MKMMVWNCQGLRGSWAISQIEEVCRLHSPDLVFLCETKNKSNVIRRLCNRLKFADFFTVEPLGLSGGMAVLWQQGVAISTILPSFCSIEMQIWDATNNTAWWFKGIYANPNPVDRRTCWSYLSSRMPLWGSLFVLAGDFNDILSSKEKLGGVPRSGSSCRDFRNFVADNNLFDLGFKGQFWTWKRTQGGAITTLERMGKRVSTTMNHSLMLPISESEVRRAVFSMKTYSAPGPDDAAWIRSSGLARGGVVIYDKNYNLVEIWGRSFENFDSALRAEAEVVRWALLLAKDRGWSNMMIKTDSLLLTQMVNEQILPQPDLCVVILDIRSLLNDLGSSALCYLNRKCNIVSHQVASFAKKLHNPAFWTGFFHPGSFRQLWRKE